jgi:hypothetical protein
MVSAMTVPTPKQAAAVPTRTAPSRSTVSGMNGSTAVITRQANNAQSAVDIANSTTICGDSQG